MNAITETLPLSLLPGCLYHFCGIASGEKPDGSPIWRYPPGVYRLIGVARYYRTLQELVMYIGVGGWDDGNTHLAPLSDWATQFTLIDESPAEESAPEPLPPFDAKAKVGGRISREGS